MKLPVIPSSVPTHDNTMMQAWRRCPRWYYIRHVRGMRAKGQVSAALSFGSLIHDALAVWYRTFNPEKVLDFLRDAEYYEHPDDYRTRGRAMTTMFKYMEHYGREPSLDILFTESAVDVEDHESGFKWGGRLDLGVSWNDAPWVMDHKSTAVGTTRWWSDYEMSPQMAGYVWAGSILHGEPLKGVIINRLTIQKKEKPAEVEFSRRAFLYPEWKIREWMQQMTEEYKAVHQAREASHFPPNWHACSGKYGLCDAHPVCTTPPNNREGALSNDFEHDPWDWTDDV